MPVSRTASIPRRIDLSASTEEMALHLRHLPGFAWLDTAGNNQQPDEGLSILAALPNAWVDGHLSNGEPLRQLLNIPGAEFNADLGLPAGGLIGSVDYNGAFHFERCEHLLIHRHSTGEWWELGNLLSHAVAHESRPAAVDLQFQPLTSRETFCQMVRRAKEYIAAGDIYQVNLTHCFQADWPDGADVFGLYLKLREISPSPYAAFLNQGGRTILSSSPESFLKMNGGLIQTRPIKGTRPRFRDRAADQKSMLDLLSSEKERAELLMITDLERNDLGRISEFGSVNVPELLKLERFAQVFHLVSTVQGTLREDVDQVAALQSCFPGGSITGAPKKRAREIIAELETKSRGLYTGAIGFLGASGDSHFNIAIRTIVIENGKAEFHVGAGIVADSDPFKEWEETLHKASGMLAAAGMTVNPH